MDITLVKEEVFHNPNQGLSYQMFKVPQFVIDEVEAVTKEISYNFDTSIPYQSRLAGEIQHEYGIEVRRVPNLAEFTVRAVTDFESNTNYLRNNANLYMALSIDDFWVNFQRKHEYNPLHSHSGIYSYVYWHKVPFTYEDEKKHQHSLSEVCHHGLFNFYVPTSHGINTIPLKVDKEAEGYMCVFPSTLNHGVNPFFSSDNYRITIAGNIMGHTQQTPSLFREDGLLDIGIWRENIEVLSEKSDKLWNN